MSIRPGAVLAPIASLAVLGVGLWIADLVLQPIPMPAGGAAVFAWAAYWGAPARFELRACGAGFVAGALVGVAFHVRSHVVEDRVEGLPSLARHALADLAVSVTAAALILAAAIGWRVVMARRARTEPRTTPP